MNKLNTKNILRYGFKNWDDKNNSYMCVLAEDCLGVEGRGVSEDRRIPLWICTIWPLLTTISGVFVRSFSLLENAKRSEIKKLYEKTP